MSEKEETIKDATKMMGIVAKQSLGSESLPKLLSRMRMNELKLVNLECNCVSCDVKKSLSEFYIKVDGDMFRSFIKKGLCKSCREEHKDKIVEFYNIMETGLELEQIPDKRMKIKLIMMAIEEMI